MDNRDDIIDSREVIDEITMLKELLAEFPDDDLNLTWRADLDKLQHLAAEAEDYSEDWQYGATLIRDSYFTEYAKELAEDIVGGEIRNLFTQWPTNCIDWDVAARELQTDYAAVNFDGVTYWIR